MQVREEFTVGGPAAEVKALLDDPEAVVACIPGCRSAGRAPEGGRRWGLVVDAGPATVDLVGTVVRRATGSAWRAFEVRATDRIEGVLADYGYACGYPSRP